VKLLKWVNNFRILEFSSLYSDVHSPLQNVVIEREKRNRWDNEKYTEFRTNSESDKINKLKNKILGVKQMVS
jgi:hypothetical protein